jgi:putative addiction module component (TIGR02574 family)
MTGKTLLAKARTLPVSERVELIDGIGASFGEDDMFLADDWFKESDLKEWKRRSDELDQFPERALSAEQMKSRLQKR